MAGITGEHVQQPSTSGINEVREEKWAKHYSSNHRILLVGEGDFSFALSLAMAFGSATNIVASSLDSYDDLIKKYMKAKANLEALGNFGAQLVHGVNAIKLKSHTDLRNRKFDRIVYNFPDAGILKKDTDDYTITANKNLVQSFMWNARHMLYPKGEIHVTHRTSHPYSCWNIEELASECGLTMVECVDFKIEDYPCYNNKRGDGRNPDLPFPPEKCCTFKFVVSSKAMNSPPEFPLQRQSKLALANMDPVEAVFLTCVTACLIPDDLSDLLDDLEPSSSGVGSGHPPHN